MTRCPSLLTLSSETAARKVEELQEALPPGLDARSVLMHACSARLCV